MNMTRAFPEQLPPPPPPGSEQRKRLSAFLLTALLVFVLVLALILIYPLLASPSSQPLTSADWSGYSVASALSSPQPTVTSINGSWTVPSVNVSFTNSFSAVWIGVGGQFDNTLIQVGTQQDSIRGQGQYSAWYEVLPADAVTIDSLSISSGDSIEASVFISNSTADMWTIEIRDITNGQSFHKSLLYDSSMLSAEWIMERPTVSNRVGTLADFGQVTFTDCEATIGGSLGTISSFPSFRITMYDRQNRQLVSVSSLSAGGSSFAVNYLD
jgi:hypothetical protein